MKAARARLLLAGLTLLFTPPASVAQDPEQRLMAADGKPLEFDVVSVRPNRSGAVPMSIVSPPMSNGVTITNAPAEDIV